jgi:hypothetical protein
LPGCDAISLTRWRHPGDERSIRFGVEHLHRTGPEAVAGQYLLWRKRRDLWKHWASVRNPHLSGARKMECVKSDLEEQAEHLRPRR